jgi:hypothetical protein
MLPMRPVIFGFLLLSGLATNPSAGQQARQPESNTVRVKGRIVEQKYCRGDADAFTISLNLEIEIENPSKTSVYLPWPMVPWVGKVASSIGDADAGQFLYQQTASYYPQSKTHFERLKVEPGKKVSKQSEYYLIARNDPAFSLADSLAAGTYALVLVLSPEEVPPAQMQGPDTLKSITTRPFMVEVPTHPKLVNCEAGAKNQ